VGIYVYLLIVVVTLKEKGVMQMTRLYTFTKVSQLDVHTPLLHHSVTNLLHTYRQAQSGTLNPTIPYPEADKWRS